MAPSSGNLQTTELHLLLPALEGLAEVPAAWGAQTRSGRKGDLVTRMHLLLVASCYY